jgi:hypothetical protein
MHWRVLQIRNSPWLWAAELGMQNFKSFHFPAQCDIWILSWCSLRNHQLIDTSLSTAQHWARCCLTNMNFMGILSSEFACCAWAFADSNLHEILKRLGLAPQHSMFPGNQARSWRNLGEVLSNRQGFACANRWLEHLQPDSNFARSSMQF